MSENPVTFTPTDASKEKYRVLAEKLRIQYNEEFFSFWESQGDHADAPREAGTLVAHALLDIAVRIAVFGTVCAGREPEIGQWRAVCDEHFNRAIGDVTDAMKIAEEES